MSSKKWDLKTTDISIMNRGTFNSFLECANRISKDEEMKRLYDEYGVLDDKYEENISRIYKDFLINIKNGKFPLNCSNYKVTTKEYGYFYPIEIWKYVKPMIVYFAYKGTYTGDSFNIANCMMEITNPYDISTYRIYYDFNEYVAAYMSCLVINAASFLIVFIMAYVVIKIIEGALNLISKLPVLHSINAIGGLICGLIHGLIIIWLLGVVIMALAWTGPGQWASAQINNNPILGVIYNYNLIVLVLTNMGKMLF